MNTLSNSGDDVPGQWATGYADLSNEFEDDGGVGGSYYDDESVDPDSDSHCSGDDDSPRTAMDAGALLAKMELNALAKRNASLTDEVDGLRAEIMSLRSAAARETPPTPPSLLTTASSSCAECAQSHVSAAMWESVCWSFFRLQRQEVQEWSYILSQHHHLSMEVERRLHIDTIMKRIVIINEDPVARCINRWGGENV